jgi:HK97 family phage prohead protease
MPFKPEERTYRSFAASNFQPVERALDEIDYDDPDKEHDYEPSYRVRGAFTTFNDWYELVPGFFERVAPTALDNTDMSDVVMQFNHSGMVLARQRNGSLRLGVGPDDAWCEADLSGCQQARDLFEAISNGLVDEMSFGFIIAEDGFELEEDEDGNYRSTITNVSKIFDISAVDRPANPNTEISARSYAESAIEAREKAAEAEREKQEAEAEQLRAAEAAKARRKRLAAALSIS